MGYPSYPHLPFVYGIHFPIGQGPPLYGTLVPPLHARASSLSMETLPLGADGALRSGLEGQENRGRHRGADVDNGGGEGQLGVHRQQEEGQDRKMGGDRLLYELPAAELQGVSVRDRASNGIFSLRVLNPTWRCKKA